MYKEQRATLKNELKQQDAVVKKAKPNQNVISKLEDKYDKLNNGMSPCLVEHRLFVTVVVIKSVGAITAGLQVFWCVACAIQHH